MKWHSKYAISLISGKYKMRPPDINLWCIDSDCKPCVVIVPLSAWERMNSIITLTTSDKWNQVSSPHAKHSQEQKLIISTKDNKTVEESSREETTMANCGFKNLYTENPIFLPVLMSVAVSNKYFTPLYLYLRNHSTPPKSLAQGFLDDIEFIDSDETLCIPLYRRSKNLKKFDKFSIFPNGDKIEIFETYTYHENSKENNLKDALETAYLMLKQHHETAERENISYDGFAEKRSIIDIVSHYYKISDKEAEDIYFEAVIQMDKEWKKKNPK